MGLKIEINGGQMKVNGQEVDLTNPEVANKYGISGPIKGMSREESESLREELARARAEREASLARAKVERERFRAETDTNRRKDDADRASSSKATIFGLTAEQLANNEFLNLGTNVYIKMKNVKIDDTYVPDFEYGGNKSNKDSQQSTEEEKDDFDFEIGAEVYEQAYRETIPQQKGVFAKLKELMRSIFRNGENHSER